MATGMELCYLCKQKTSHSYIMDDLEMVYRWLKRANQDNCSNSEQELNMLEIEINHNGCFDESEKCKHGIGGCHHISTINSRIRALRHQVTHELAIWLISNPDRGEIYSLKRLLGGRFVVAVKSINANFTLRNSWHLFF